MEDSNYDEFGNYIGDDLSDAESIDASEAAAFGVPDI